MPYSKFSLMPKLRLREGDCLLLPYLDSEKAMYVKSALPKEIQKIAHSPKDAGGNLTLWRGKSGGRDLLVHSVRLDAKYSDSHRELKKAVAATVATAAKEGCRRLVVLLNTQHSDWLLDVHEAAWLGAYSFDRYLSKKAKPIPIVATGLNATGALGRLLREREVIFEATNIARDLMNEPSNVKNPVTLAKEYERWARKSGLRVKVWDDRRLVREGCGGLLGVGMGAKAKPRMVIAEYAPRGARKHLCLVGKGVTYDTGGYGLKSAASQIGMKYDMGGSATMFGAATAIARLRLPLRVTVFTPLAENDISGEAIHTTAVLTTRSGKTIEVEHTDAEGRIILADALTLAGERKPDWIIDAATLTGACVVALGEEIAGVFGTDPKFTQSLIAAGQAEGELFWELPLHLPHSEKIKTTIADVKNRGDAWGGAVTAAVFLKQWVADDARWVHIDMAGPGCKEAALDHLGKGAKGFGVKTLVRLARILSTGK